MSDKVVRIPSKLYAKLFALGGDKLIAVYCILKASRNGEVKYYAHTSKNNKKVSGYNLLRKQTSLSLHAIEKYVPMLIKMGLCYIDFNGDFVLIGNDKLKKTYNTKLLPILVGKNLNNTADSSLAVRVFSKHKEQKKQIAKKLTQREQLAQITNPRSLKEYKAAKRLERQGFDGSVLEKTVLSLQGFSVLKQNGNKIIKDVKSNGAYYKKKLKNKNIIKTKREFEKIEQISYGEYLNRKEAGILSNRNVYRNGWLMIETVSSFSLVSSVNEEKPVTIPQSKSKPIVEYKKKTYLQFDMIDFWLNGENC